ncbi:hypothetical protein B0H67DRAFT_107886 [Lasiosphaeris hirsuta]|uniref:Uncharacterized protein n=1 Tax=Lasiosphaeris hirsuta TaxID=260670 RepID=A0AA40E6R2_9PEZI|nr:hypothetical protein B0H67DRAFT_107886 [Lasiosphaeris hirsuta]
MSHVIHRLGKMATNFHLATEGFEVFELGNTPVTPNYPAHSEPDLIEPIHFFLNTVIPSCTTQIFSHLKKATRGIVVHLPALNCMHLRIHVALLRICTRYIMWKLPHRLGKPRCATVIRDSRLVPAEQATFFWQGPLFLARGAPSLSVVLRNIFCRCTLGEIFLGIPFFKRVLDLASLPSSVSPVFTLLFLVLPCPMLQECHI